MAWTKKQLQTAHKAAWHYTQTIDAGETSDVLAVSAGSTCTIVCKPAAGATGTVQTTKGPVPASGDFLDWEPGGVTDDTERTFYGSLTGVKFTAADDSVTVEVVVA